MATEKAYSLIESGTVTDCDDEADVLVIGFGAGGSDGRLCVRGHLGYRLL